MTALRPIRLLLTLLVTGPAQQAVRADQSVSDSFTDKRASSAPSSSAVTALAQRMHLESRAQKYQFSILPHKTERLCAICQRLRRMPDGLQPCQNRIGFGVMQTDGL